MQLKSQVCQKSVLPNHKCANDELIEALHVGNSCNHFISLEKNHCNVSSIFEYKESNPYYQESQQAYDFVTLNFHAYLNTGWFLIWNDDFNYGVLDGSFWRVGYDYGNSTGKGTYVYTPDNILVSDGKLKLTAKFNNDPNYVVSYCGDPPLNTSNPNYCGTGHFDYTSGAVSTYIYFPVGSRFQTINKIYPNPKRTFPALWLWAAQPGSNQWNDNKYQEIDIYELTDDISIGYDDATPWQNLKLTYHSTKYGYQGRRRYEQVYHNTGIDLTATFNQYDLIWDNYKVQWWFNGNVINEVNRYYHIPNNWNDNNRNKKFRSYPIHNGSGLIDKINDNKKKFAHNNYFPGSYPMYLLFNVALESQYNDDEHKLIPEAVGDGKAQEMEYLRIWLRRSCDANATISQNNFIRNTSQIATIIETGKNISTSPGSVITLTGAAPRVYAIYAAINEIALADGFSVEQDAIFFGFISSCENAWEQRVIGLEDEEAKNNSSYESNEASISLNNSQIEQSDIIYKTFTDKLVIESTTSDIKKLELYDSKGSLILDIDNIGCREYTINKGSIVNGFYVLKCYSKATIDVKKLIIE